MHDKARIVMPERELVSEELQRLVAAVADEYFDLARRPLPAVLDTACVRPGLHFHMKNGYPPKSVTAARDNAVRLFVEYDTLAETSAHLAKFGKQLGVSAAELRRVLNEDWLPYIEVVKLPASLRQLDPRAVAVHDRDPDDYPAAALAALLSPCILLTHNYKDFAALGMRTTSQGIDAVQAVAAINVGEMRVRAVVTVPAMPFMAIGSAAKWASGRIGPAAWGIVAAIALGGICLYFKQPLDRRERIKNVASEVGKHVIEEYVATSVLVEQARDNLHACVVPRPEARSTISAILRELAVSPESLSAQQLADLLDPSLRPSVAGLRACLRANGTLFAQVRRGGFVLGRHYTLPDP